MLLRRFTNSSQFQKNEKTKAVCYLIYNEKNKRKHLWTLKPLPAQSLITTVHSSNIEERIRPKIN